MINSDILEIKIEKYENNITITACVYLCPIPINLNGHLWKASKSLVSFSNLNSALDLLKFE